MASSTDDETRLSSGGDLLQAHQQTKSGQLRRSPFSSTSSTATSVSAKPFAGIIAPSGAIRQQQQQQPNPHLLHPRMVDRKLCNQRPYSFRDFLRIPGRSSGKSSASLY